MESAKSSSTERKNNKQQTTNNNTQQTITNKTQKHRKKQEHSSSSTEKQKKTNNLESTESIYFLHYCSVGWDDEILSNEVKSLGVKFLYLISNTHQVFLVLGKHTSLTAALLIERFLLIIQQGGISFYNLFNFNH